MALTSCTASDTVYSGRQIIKFPSTKTSIGINNLADFKTTGKFTCEKTGVYLFVVHVAYKGNDDNAQFIMYKNDQILSYVMIVYGTHGDNYFSGSGTVVVQLIAGDILIAKSNERMTVTGLYSCFTVLKIN